MGVQDALLRALAAAGVPDGVPAGRLGRRGGRGGAAGAEPGAVALGGRGGRAARAGRGRTRSTATACSPATTPATSPASGWSPTCRRGARSWSSPACRPTSGPRTPVTPAAATGNGNRWNKFHTSRSVIGNKGQRLRHSRIVNVEDYERTTRPSLIGAYRRGGVLLGRLGLDPVGPRLRRAREGARRRWPTTGELAAQSTVVYRATPFKPGAEAGGVQLRLVVRLLSAGLRAAGADDEVYRLRGGRCSGSSSEQARRSASRIAAAAGSPGRAELDVIDASTLAPSRPQGRPGEHLTQVDLPIGASYAALDGNVADDGHRPVHLARAIELAERGRGRTSPNPLVGAVIVRDGEVLGEGWHAALGGPHAEREALAACRRAPTPRGATMYVSLEPCCHTRPHAALHRRDRSRPGSPAWWSPPTTRPRRPPAAGWASCATRASRSRSSTASWRRAARLLNQPFRKHARTGRPWVLFKSAMTLDGKVATQTGDSKWISGEGSRALAHRWRAESDAVAVGHRHRAGRRPAASPRASRASSASRAGWSSTPRRGCRWTPSSCARPPRSRWSWWSPAPRRGPPPTRWRRRASRSSSRPARTSPPACARRWTSSARLGVTSILLEGGPHLAGAFLDAGEVDEVRLFLAPMLLGGRMARDPLEGEGVEAIAEAVRALTLDCEQVGEDC